MKGKLTDIRYELTTMSGKTCDVRYRRSDSGLQFLEVGEPIWSGDDSNPMDASDATESVEVEFKWQGGERTYASLSGDQHRDLESANMTQDWFARVADGVDAEEALEEVWEACSASVRP